MAVKKPEHIKFVFLTFSKTGKTKIWEVYTNYSGVPLGSVKWYGKWRKYSFYPANDTLFEQQCLRDIADFCEIKTAEHNRVVRAVKHLMSLKKKD